jgi:methanogenic corrinoid protein MtbC1
MLGSSEIAGLCLGERTGSGGMEASAARGAFDAIGATIERDIIPRLYLAHRAPPPARAYADGAIDSHHVHAFADLLLDADDDEAMARVRELVARGVALESILLDLLGPAARRLGEMWEADLCSFMDVTLGLFRLQTVLARWAHDLDEIAPQADLGPSVLLAAAPGEQHTFGLLVVQELLTREGFRVELSTGGGRDVIRRLETRPFSALGLSVARVEALPDLREFVLEARRESRNRRLAVALGGQACVKAPREADAVGGDRVVTEGRDVVSEFNALTARDSTAGISRLDRTGATEGGSGVVDR